MGILKLNRKSLIFLIISYVVTIVLAIIFKITILALAASLLGITAVLYNSSGKKICFAFYIVHCILYAINAFSSKMYGELIIYSIYLTPLYAYSLICFIKGNNDKKQDIQFLNIKHIFLIIALNIILTIIYGLILKSITSELPFLNALLTSLSLTCGFLTAKRYFHQWYFWIVYSLMAMLTWGIVVFNGSSNGMAFVCQNLLCFILNIEGLLSWRKIIKDELIKNMI